MKGFSRSWEYYAYTSIAFKLSTMSKKTSKPLKENGEKLNALSAEITGFKRELKIEAALERVRVRAMAMRHSDELQEAVAVIFKELSALDFDPSICSIGTYDKATKGCNWWMFDETELLHTRNYHMPYLKEDRWFREVYDTWKKQKPLHRYEDSGASLKKSHKLILEKTDLKYLPESSKKVIRAQKSLKCWYVSTTHGLIELITESQLSKEQVATLQRFAKVIDLTYIRVDDLQKAEAQTREAEIELALERIRSRTMEMQKSEELSEVVAVIYKQVQELGFSDWACAIIICDDINKVLQYWNADSNQSLLPGVFNVPVSKQPVVQKQWKSWRKGIRQFTIDLLGTKKDEYTHFMLNETDHKNLPPEVKAGWLSAEDVHFSYSYMKYGLLEFTDVEPLKEENFPIYGRFAKVFEQTYTRFLDLQKAEAQAREAQIEAALERVRQHLWPCIVARN